MLAYVFSMCGWYLLLPLIVFLFFVFVPDYCARWMVTHDYLIRRYQVRLILHLRLVRKYFTYSIIVSLKTNNLAYEYQI